MSNTPYICFCCNRAFQPKYAPDNPDRPYCSRSCAAKINNVEKQKRKLEGTCKQCFAACNKRKTFCGHACFILFTRAHAAMPKRIRKKRTTLPKDNANNKVTRFYRKQKLKALTYMGSCCRVCGYNKSVRAMNFHHKDESQKEFTISGRAMSWDRMVVELNKCILLCANCHAEVHDEIISVEHLLPGPP